VCDGDGSSCFAEFEFTCGATSDAPLSDVINSSATLAALRTSIETALNVTSSDVITNIDLSVDFSFRRRKLLDNGFVSLWITFAQSLASGLLGDTNTAFKVCACLMLCQFACSFDGFCVPNTLHHTLQGAI
jgi:hypothetical protein